jgi:hypothetical protein
MVTYTKTERAIVSTKNSKEFIASGDEKNNVSYCATSGNAVSATINTITLASGADNIYNNLVIEIVSGQGINQCRLITGFVSQVATITPEWNTIPDTTSIYIVHINSGICQNQTQNNTNITIKLSSTASSINNFYDNCVIKLLSDTIVGDVRHIHSYNGTTKLAVIEEPLIHYPDNTTLYIIYGESGDVNEATTNTITLAGDQSTYIQEKMYIHIYDGTGQGQLKQIININGDILTLSSNWDTNYVPDSTSKYNIFSGWGGEYDDIHKHAIATISAQIHINEGQKIIMKLCSAMQDYGKYENCRILEYNAMAPSNTHAIVLTTKYLMLKIISTGLPIDGYVQTIYNSYKSGKVTMQINDNISENNDCDLMRSVLMGQTVFGDFKNISATTTGQLSVSIDSPLDQFGNLKVVEPLQYLDLTFPYNYIHPHIVGTEFNNGGSVTASNSLAILNTSTNTTGTACLYTKKRARYTPGLAINLKFTAILNTPTATSTQIIGYGDQNNGLFVGYDGLVFGVLRRYGVISEVRRFTIS